MKSPRTRVSSAIGSQAITTARIARRTACRCPARISPSEDSRWYGGAHSNGTRIVADAALMSCRCSWTRCAALGGWLRRLRRLAFALLLLDVPLEEVVEKGADHGDRTDASDGLPAGADGGRDDVCGQLKSEPSHQPACVAQPCLTGKLITQWFEAGTSNLDRYLDGPDDYDEQCQRVDQRDRRFTDG